MMPISKYIFKNKAAYFDWLVFGISFSLGFIFTSLRDFLTSPGFSLWMLAALLLYSMGAALKHLPLRFRLSNSGMPVKKMPILIFLVIGHFCIFYMVIFFSISAIKKIFTAGSAIVKSTAGNPDILIAILAAIFITWLVFRPKREISRKVIYSGKNLFIMELVADILLVIAVSILSFAFWEKGVVALLTRKTVSNIGDIWFLFVFLSITYILFYLPLRYLFLIDDHNHSGTWKRLLLIFGLLLLKSLFEILKI